MDEALNWIREASTTECAQMLGIKADIPGNFAVFLPYVGSRSSGFLAKLLILLVSPTGFEPVLPP